MASPLYRTLKKRLDKLAAGLPSAPTAGNPVSADQMDSISFYAVMSHAACEIYIEQRCIEVADYAVDKFNASKKLNRIVKHLCLMPFLTVTKHDKDRETFSRVLGKAGVGISVTNTALSTFPAEIEGAINKGHSLYLRSVQQNNGISLKYKFKLLSYLGMDLGALDPSFISRLDQMARLRGDAAHTGVIAAQTMPNVSDLPSWTNDLITGYLTVDKSLQKLKSARN